MTKHTVGDIEQYGEDNDIDQDGGGVFTWVGRGELTCAAEGLDPDDDNYGEPHIVHDWTTGEYLEDHPHITWFATCEHCGEDVAWYDGEVWDPKPCEENGPVTSLVEPSTSSTDEPERAPSNAN